MVATLRNKCMARAEPYDSSDGSRMALPVCFQSEGLGFCQVRRCQTRVSSVDPQWRDFTDTLHSAPFRWQDLRSDRWHWLRAVGEKGSTTFYCNGQEVATIPGNPGSRWPERFGGDIDARNPQGAGLIRKIQFQIPTSRSCKAN